MKARLCRVLTGVVVLVLLAVTVAACAGAKKATTSTPATRSAAAAPVVSTLAGRAGSRGHTDGSGAAARFDAPAGIACDAAGNLYVADTTNDTIRKITAAGEVTTLAGKAGSPGSADGSGSAARFNAPSGIACDAAGNLYVADTMNYTIRKITPVGEVTTLAGKAGSWGSADGSGAAARFNAPKGVACDADGNVYVTDTMNYTIRKITAAGEVTTLAGQAVSPGSADGSGAAARFFMPSRLACDAAGNLYVADYGNSTIRKITPDGQVTTLAGKAGSAGRADGSGSAARFDGPSSIACDASGNLVVADTLNNTIRKIKPDGQVTTLAGKAGFAGRADGSGSAARFFMPSGIARDTAGNLYVADTENSTIRKIMFGE